jgi:hypothetical protein
VANITDLTRRYRLQINLGTLTVPLWSTVIGIVEFKPSVEPEIQDDTDYESDGWKGNTKTLQGWQIEAKISHKYDPVTKLYHPTHVALEAASEAFGDASYVDLRYFDRFGKGSGRRGRALVTWEPEGGEASELDQVSITLTGDGPLETIDNPLTVSPLPIVASLSPASGPAAGGDLVVINGAYFDGATAVTFDGAAATDFQVISASAIAAVTPAGTAGPCDVAVTTPNGVGTGTGVYTYT